MHTSDQILKLVNDTLDNLAYVRFQTVKMYWKTTGSGWLFLTR